MPHGPCHKPEPLRSPSDPNFSYAFLLCDPGPEGDQSPDAGLNTPVPDSSSVASAGCWSARAVRECCGYVFTPGLLAERLMEALLETC